MSSWKARERHILSVLSTGAASTSLMVMSWGEEASSAGNSSMVNAVAATGGRVSREDAPDGALLATGSRDKTLRLWDVATWSPVYSFEHERRFLRNVSFTSDGRYLAFGSTSYEIAIVDLEDYETVQMLGGAESPIIRQAFTPDGRILVGSTMRGSKFPKGAWMNSFVPEGFHLTAASVSR